MVILCFGDRVNGPIFRAKNHLYTSFSLFWDTLYISFSQNQKFLISLSVVLVLDFGNMCHDTPRRN